LSKVNPRGSKLQHIVTQGVLSIKQQALREVGKKYNSAAFKRTINAMGRINEYFFMLP